MENTRTLTTAERRKVDGWLKSVERLDRASFLVDLHVVQYAVALDFGKKMGIALPGIGDIAEKSKLLRLAINRAKRWAVLLKSGALGVQFSEGDFSILAPPGTSDDVIADYKSMGMIVAFVVGAIVAVGVIAYVALLESHNTTLVKRIETLRYDAGAKFCDDPNSVICQTWLQREKAEGYKQTEGKIESVKKWLSGAAESAKTGLGWGIAIAIPLVLIWLSGKVGRND